MKILITGGAGYIGSHVVKALGLLKHDLTIYDDLSTGHKEAVTYGELVVGDLADREKLDKLFAQKKFEAIIHFAGSIVVPHSVSEPLRYYQNNTVNSHSLLTLCQKHGVKNFIFSSTAAVYGMPKDGVCREDSTLAPINPYGQSKLMTEHMLRDFAASSDFRFVALRYFNVSGADPEGRIGQSFPQATHLIKVACEVACGKREKMEIFGTDYDTPDGTCVRDYVHVDDLCAAHLLALDHLVGGGKSAAFNLGNGQGFSVREVIATAERVTGKTVPHHTGQRRPGDPPRLVADASRAISELGWQPQRADLETIIADAWRWECRRP